MKKVLLTKTVTCAANRTATLPPASSLATARTTTTTKVITASPLPSQVDKSNTYQQRKIMEPAYRELFRALFRLPDKDVQQRVMDAINGVAQPTVTYQLCQQCKLQRKRSYATTMTQTDIGIWTPSVATSAKVGTVSGMLFGIKTEPNCNTTTSDDDNEKLQPTAANTAPVDNTPPVRKRRKRKVCVPQVIKKSQAQQARSQQQHQPSNNKKRKMDVIEKKKENPPSMICNGLANRARSDSMCSSIFSDGVLELITNDSDLETFLQVEMRRTMAIEFLDSGVMQNGLLRIHTAIIKDDRDVLQRQIFVWKELKKVDLNELLTDEDEDCLQLAVVHDCHTEIIEILLTKGLSTNISDDQSNTILHLALLNQIKLKSLALLLEQINLSLLLQLNDDGHTPLHIAVRYDLYAHAEILLNVLEKRLRGSVTYKRSSSSSYIIPTKKEFLKYYENVCDHLNTRSFALGYSQLVLKQKLLECGEMRSGNTALFVAIENKMEHFIYFLLAHFCDPRVPNHGGQDPKSYFSEFSKVLNLSLKIDQTMEKVIQAKEIN